MVLWVILNRVRINHLINHLINQVDEISTLRDSHFANRGNILKL